MTIRAVARQHMPGGEEAQNVFHFSGNALDSTVANDIGSLISGFYEQFDDQLSNDWNLFQIDVGLAGVGVEFSFDITGVVGAYTGVPAPNDCALVIHWRSNAGGRRGRGRTFLGGWGVDALTQQGSNGPTVWSGTPLSQVGPAAESMIDNALTVDFVLLNSNPVGESLVQGGYVSTRIGTQRRRDMETPEDRLVF